MIAVLFKGQRDGSDGGAGQACVCVGDGSLVLYRCNFGAAFLGIE
jgi:hypothetical protein